MSEEDKKDPLEGFHFDEYDEDRKALTIRVHKYILTHSDQKEALMEKVAEILLHDDKIESVIIKKRDE